jgi:hypothetical protein
MLNHVIYNIYSTDVGPLKSHLTWMFIDMGLEIAKHKGLNTKS